MRKRHLLLGNLLFLFLFVPSVCFGASCVSCATGDWTNQNTWNIDAAGCGVTASHPDSGDTVTIANGTTVTVNESHNLGTCTVEGNLVLGTGVTATTNGTFTVGNGASKEGHLTLGAGSTLAMGTNGIVNNNAMWRSNSTSGSWAKITGSGNISNGTVYSGGNVKQDIDLQYVSFQITGSIGFAIGGLGTITTNQARFTNVTFNNAGGAEIGYTGQTAATTPIQFTYCDFRQFASNTRLRVNGLGPNANFWIKFCTFYGTNSNSTNVFITDGLIEDSIFGGYWTINTTSPNATTSKTYRRILVSSSIMASGGTVFYLGDGSALEDSYIHLNYVNAHPLTGAAGSATWNILRNVWEQEDTTQTAEHWGINDTNRLHTNNIVINAIGFFDSTGTNYAKTVNCKNTTFWSTVNPGEGPLFLSAHGINISGTLNLVNNLVAGSATVTAGVSADDLTKTINSLAWSGGTATADTSSSHYLVTGETVTITGASRPQYNGTFTVTYVDSNTFTYVCDDPGGTSPSAALSVNRQIQYSDYNSFYNVTTRYDETYITIVSGKTHDMTADPKFVDNTRRFSKWNQRFGSGTDSSADGLTYFLGINGYRGTPDFDQQGTVSSRKVSSLVDWVQYGFSPTNAALRKAGDPADGSPTIGAMEWQNPRRKRAM